MGHKLVWILVPTTSALLSLPHPTYSFMENVVRPVNGGKKERSALLMQLQSDLT